MGRADIISADGSRFRVRPWPEDARTASLVLLPGGRVPSGVAINTCLAQLRERRYSTVLTGALAHYERSPFFDSGFQLHHELHLLSRVLGDIAAPRRRAPDRVIRAARKRDWPAVVDLDRKAFNTFWRFDTNGISDALKATPIRRFRIVGTEHSPVSGYHISGFAGKAGYLQRLAVHPGLHRRGIGSVLISDALGWMQNRGATTGWVNTQVGNDVALATYLAHGFVLQKDRLVVLSCSLDGAPPHPSTEAQTNGAARQ